MSDKRPPSESENARARAQKFFTASEEREAQIKHMIESERTKRDANTAKLRALRLAKEEADRAKAASAPREVPAAKPNRKSKSKKTRLDPAT